MILALAIVVRYLGHRSIAISLRFPSRDIRLSEDVGAEFASIDVDIVAAGEPCQPQRTGDGSNRPGFVFELGGHEEVRQPRVCFAVGKKLMPQEHGFGRRPDLVAVAIVASLGAVFQKAALTRTGARIRFSSLCR